MGPVWNGSCGNTTGAYVLSFHQKMSSECCKTRTTQWVYFWACLWMSPSAGGENKTDWPDLIKASSLAGDCDQLFAIFFLCWCPKKKSETTAYFCPSFTDAYTQCSKRTAHLILSSSSMSLQVRRPSLSRWQIISYPMLLMKSSVWNHNTHVQICRVKKDCWIFR